MTILCNKFDGHPKGFAYVEFTDKDSVSTAMALDESLFRGRQIKVCIAIAKYASDAIVQFMFFFWSDELILKVMPKRTNKPGISTTNRPPRFAIVCLIFGELIFVFQRGRGGRSRGRGRGFGGGYMRRPRGGYRGRGAYYSPY